MKNNMEIMNKLRKRQVSILGRSIPIFFIVAVLMSGTVVALLTVYITISGTAAVAQSVILTDIMTSWMDDTATSSFTENSGTYDFEAAGGDTQDMGFKVNNQALETDALVDFVPGVTGAGTLGNDVTITFYGGFNETTEQCIGTAITPTDVLLTAGSEQWFCARHEFMLNANPGDYSFTITVVPS